MHVTMSKDVEIDLSYVQKNEGCRLSGKIHVAKVAGRIQLIPGATFRSTMYMAPASCRVLRSENELLLHLGQ